LRGLFIAPMPALKTHQEKELFAARSVELALLFWRESRARLQEAVDEVHSPRLAFADVPFQEANAMFAPQAWLFNVHLDSATLRLVPEDDQIGLRHEQCLKCHQNDPLGIEVAACDIASAGHPNREGARQFADAILARIGR
jgi:hypothetical protein